VIRARGNLCVALEGLNISDVAKRLVFRNNRVENGAVKFREVDGLIIEGNTISGLAVHAPLELPSVRNAQIIGNDISGERGEAMIVVEAQYDVANAYPAALPAQVTLSGNRIQSNGGQPGLLIQDALGDITIQQNEIYGVERVGIPIVNRLSSGSPRSGFTVSGNLVRNFAKGIMFGTDGDFYRNVRVTGNTINHDQTPPTPTVGIVFSKTGPYQTFATVTGNAFGSGILTGILLLLK
jgi:hypothetical protein